MDAKARFGFVVEYVKDMEAARRFYEEAMGLQIQRHHPTFIQFENFAIATDEPLGGESTQELYWLVDDAEAALRERSAKAEVCLPLTTLPFGKVFGIRDPDGHPCYLLELAHERPSVTAG